MKKLHLKIGYVAFIDDEDFFKVSQYSWIPHLEYQNKVYAMGYKKGNRHRPYLHRLVMNPEKNHVVDFKNKNTLDCQKSNLVIVPRSVFSRKSRKWRTRKGKPTSSVFKGVFYNRENNRWVASSRYGNTIKYLGSFKSETEAAKAYNRFQREIQKEYIYQNVPAFNREKGLYNETEYNIDKQYGDIQINVGSYLNAYLTNIIQESIHDSQHNSDDRCVLRCILSKLLVDNHLVNEQELNMLIWELVKPNDDILVRHPVLNDEMRDFLSDPVVQERFSLALNLKNKYQALPISKDLD